MSGEMPRSSAGFSPVKMSRPADSDEEDGYYGGPNNGGPINWEAAVREPRSTEAKPVAPYAVDVARSRFPYAVVWTPLPLITWILPFIGHMGITDSRGVVYDFAGPFMIGVDDMAFGKPTRYLQLDPSKIGKTGKSPAEVWDSACDAGCDVYSKRMHNIWYAFLTKQCVIMYGTSTMTLIAVVTIAILMLLDV